MKCYIDKPYPSIRVEEKNEDYAKLLLKNFAGKVSEDTAIHLYLFQMLILKDDCKELANALEKIAIVEMHHLEMLGETIKLLGIKPVYGTMIGDYFNPWNGNNVNYTIKKEDMLKINIKAEEKAIKNYQQNIALINDKYIKVLLARIIEDEKLHIKIFKSFL